MANGQSGSVGAVREESLHVLSGSKLALLTHNISYPLETNIPAAVFKPKPAATFK